MNKREVLVGNMEIALGAHRILMADLAIHMTQASEAIAHRI